MIENLGSQVRHTDKMPKTPYSTQETTETDEDGEELTRNHSDEPDAVIRLFCASLPLLRLFQASLLLKQACLTVSR